MALMAVGDLDAIVARYPLNEHPFYRAWRAGTLPRSALSAYAADYAPFIASVEAGWRALGEVSHAAEEREHFGLWQRFRDALGGCVDAERGSNVEAAALADHARRAFADPVAAVGALYAFEAQQPSTARSKLDGLRARYGFGDFEAAYFQVHADDYGERDLLAAHAGRLTPTEFARARQACEETCLAMWAALEGAMGVASCLGV